MLNQNPELFNPNSIIYSFPSNLKAAKQHEQAVKFGINKEETNQNDQNQINQDYQILNEDQSNNQKIKNSTTKIILKQTQSKDFPIINEKINKSSSQSEPTDEKNLIITEELHTDSQKTPLLDKKSEIEICPCCQNNIKKFKINWRISFNPIQFFFQKDKYQINQEQKNLYKHYGLGIIILYQFTFLWICLFSLGFVLNFLFYTPLLFQKCPEEEQCQFVFGFIKTILQSQIEKFYEQNYIITLVYYIFYLIPLLIFQSMIFAWYTYYFRTKRYFENIQNQQFKTQKDKEFHKYYLRVKHLPFQLNKKQQQQLNQNSQIATKNEQNQNTIDQIHFQDLQVKKIQQEINLSLPTYLGNLDYQQIQQAKIQIKGYQNSKNLQNLEQIFLKYKQQIYACLSSLNELSNNNNSLHFHPYCPKALLKKKQKAQKNFKKLQKLKDKALELYKKRHINGVDDGKLLNSDLLGQEVIIYFETKEQTYLAQKILKNNNNNLVSGFKFFFFPGSLNYSDRLAVKMIPFNDISWENFGQPPKFKILKRFIVLFIGTPLTLTLILLAEIVLFFAILYEYEFMNDNQTWKEAPLYFKAYIYSVSFFLSILINIIIFIQSELEKQKAKLYCYSRKSEQLIKYIKRSFFFQILNIYYVPYFCSFFLSLYSSNTDAQLYIINHIIQNSMTGLLTNILFSFFSFQVLIYKFKQLRLKLQSVKKKKLENMCQIQFNEHYYTPPNFCLEEQIGKIISQITVGTFYLVVAPYLLIIPVISIILSLKALKYQIQHNSQDLKQQSHKIPKHLIGKWFIKNQVILCFIMVFNLPDINHSKNKAYLIFYFFTIYFTFGYCTVRSILKKRKKNKEKVLSNFYTKTFIQQLLSKNNQQKQKEEIQIPNQNKNQDQNKNLSIIDLNYSHISVENLNQGQEEEKIQEQNRAKFNSLGNFSSFQNYEQQNHLQEKNFTFQEKLNEHSTSLDVRQFDCIFNHIKDQMQKDKLDLENQVY